LELLEPTRGTTLLVYYPPGSTKAAGHGFLMDSNYLLSAINQQLKGASAGGATGDKQAEDTGFRLVPHVVMRIVCYGTSKSVVIAVGSLALTLSWPQKLRIRMLLQQPGL
jgi:hypothetical protein